MARARGLYTNLQRPKGSEKRRDPKNVSNPSVGYRNMTPTSPNRQMADP